MRRAATRTAPRAARETLLGVPIAESRARAALSLSLILALALQGVVAQGHIHSRWEALPAQGGVVVDAGLAPGHGGAPSPWHDESTTCALCQVLAAGSAPLVHAVGIEPPRDAPTWRVADSRILGTGGNAVSFDWTSRGPPLI
jgi:hypothetical protein